MGIISIDYNTFYDSYLALLKKIEHISGVEVRSRLPENIIHTSTVSSLEQTLENEHKQHNALVSISNISIFMLNDFFKLLSETISKSDPNDKKVSEQLMRTYDIFSRLITGLNRNDSSVMSFLSNLIYEEWNLRSSVYSGIIAKDTLTIHGLGISESCRFGCNYCSIDATKNGIRANGVIISNKLNMSLEFVKLLTNSSYLRFFGRDFKEPLYLGSGDIFLNPNTPEIIKYLVLEKGIYVTFTTMGFSEHNRKGIEAFLDMAKSINFHSIMISANVSFNLMNPIAVRDVDTYFELVKETLSRFEQAGISVYLLPMAKSNNNIENGLFKHIEMVTRDNHPGVQRIRAAAPLGRFFKELNGKTSSEYLGFKCEVCSSYASYKGSAYYVLPDGDILTYPPGCMGVGIHGSVLGNVYSNNPEQIKDAEDDFFMDLRNKISEDKRTSQKAKIPCEIHRTMNWKSKSDVSSLNPIIKSKLIESKKMKHAVRAKAKKLTISF